MDPVQGRIPVVHYERWVISNREELAIYLGGLFLRKFGHKMKKFTSVPPVGAAKRIDHWKSSCARCSKTIHIIRDEHHADAKRSWQSIGDDEGTLSYLAIPQYKINYGRVYKASTANVPFNASFLLMDPVPENLETLKEFPLVSRKNLRGQIPERPGEAPHTWIENAFSIPLNSFESCEIDGVVNDDFYCSRLRVLR